MIRLRVDPHSIEDTPCFIAISAFAEEELPFEGLPGRLDNLLDGEASSQIEQGHLSGTWGAQALLASRGRIAPHYVLFAGLGPFKRITLSILAARMEQIVQRVIRLSAREMGLSINYSDRSKAKYESLASETVNGVLRGAGDCPYDVNITVCEPDPARFNELVGVAEKSAFRRAEGRELSVEINV